MEMTVEIKDRVDFLIKFFNMKANTRYKFSPEKNQKAVYDALQAADGNSFTVKQYFREEIAKGNLDLCLVCESFIEKKHSEVKEAPCVEATPAPAPASGLDSTMQMMASIVTELLAKTKLSDIEQSISSRLENQVREFISAEYGTIERKIEFQLPDKKVELQGVVHEKFDTVLKFVQANEPVFLTGPAGSGKNVLCQQVAKALGLNFYFSNAVTQEYKITGFTDAMGTFHESQFYKAFKNGGLFMLDEMDASIPEVLIILNAAIANRYFDFPAPIGYVEAHPDFRVIAAGNTFGNGADYDYVGRNQLDAASLDRFAQVRIDYSARVEESCANGNTELLNFCRKFRTATKKAGIRTIVSYRSISRLAKLDAMMPTEELLDDCLIKSLEVDDLNAISSQVEGCGKYTDAFKAIASKRRT